MPPRTKPIAERFWPKVVKTETCWLWTASLSSKGYGKFGRPGKNGGWTYAHQVSWELNHGPIPDGLEVDHLCHERSCVNPSHLQVVTHAENMRRSLRALSSTCPRGHTYGEDRSAKTGRRFCRECTRLREQRRVRNRSKAAA